MQRLNEDVFSPAAQRVLQRAWAIARSNGIEEVPLATLIEGLRQEDGIAREILERLGLHDPSPSDLGRLPALPPKRLLADEVNRVFDVAESWVREVSPHLTVGSEHVLYGLIHVSEPFAQKCAAAGLTLDGLRRELMDRSGFNTGPVAVTGVDLADTTAAIEDDAISLRILDASLNRVAEGLRTVEDYLRFGLNDSALAAEAKTIRHDLQPIARRFGDERLAAVRDVPGDVGTEISLPTETVRGSAFEVAATNLSRVQESLRSAEEFAKTQDQELASCLERLRYRAYGLDKSFLRLTEGRRRLSGAQLYLLLAINGLPLPYRVIAESALAGGVDVIQLRDKTLDDAALLEAARVLRQITRDVRKLLIINDRPDIACLVDADGVHLGQDDLPVSEARRIVGPDRLIGVSTHSLEDVFGARHDGADYIGVGPTFPSQTKQFERFAGTPFVESVCRDHAIPAFAIGGIDDANIDQVTNAGCSRIAVSRAITHSEQPEVAARRLKAHLVEASGDSVGPKTVSGKTLHA